MHEHLKPIIEALKAVKDNDRVALTALATVTGTSGTSVLVQFDAEGSASTKPYKRLASYTPANGDRVLLLRSGSTWVVLGKLA